MGNEDGPPATPTPHQRRRRRFLRTLLVVGIVVVVLGAGTVGVAGFLLYRFTSGVHQTPLLGGAAATASGAAGASPAPASIDGPLNILLLGSDDRPGDTVDGARSDTILIAHVPATHDRVYLVSIPRDSRVQIPPYPKTGYHGGTDKINAAYAYGFNNGGGRAGGTELVGLALQQLTGLSFNAAAIVNFTGFQAVVDAVGGIDLCVDEKTTSVHIGWTADGKETPPYHLVPPDYHPVPIWGVRPQVYQPGCQHMAGWQALDYVRQRELIPDGDYGRERHQQQFLKALLQKATSTGVLANPLTLDSVLHNTAGAVTFDGNGYSVTDWLFNLRNIRPGDVTMVKTNGGQFNTQVIGGSDYEILDSTSMQLFQALRDDTVGAFVAANPGWVSTDGPPAPSRPPAPSPSASP
ncbi:MAG: LytR family transcriptional regulator [Actinobacteria bacterium]|nr:MAG: LytR family transcriptional regulator [Actinomycetota bacterium]